MKHILYFAKLENMYLFYFFIVPLNESVTYLGFCFGGDMILSSSSTFKVRGLKLELQKLLHIIYILLEGGFSVNRPLRKITNIISV